MIPATATALAGDGSWPSLLLLGLLGGLLALDDTALAQTWFSQPLPAALLAGMLCGDPLTGLALGLPLQLALVGNLPVGQSFTGDSATAVVALVGASVLAGRPLTVCRGADTVVQLALLGWVLLGAGLLSAAGHWIVQAERRAHALWMLEGHRTLRDGSLGRIENIVARSLVSTFLRGFVFTMLFVLLGLRAWLPAFDLLTGRVLVAAAMFPFLLPGLGLGALLDQFGLSRCWPWVLSGTAVAFVLVRLL